MFVSIGYRTDLARKGVDFLINPKGFNVKNIFDRKLIVGTVTEQNKNDFIRRYQELNPKFPLINVYVSDQNGNKISTPVSVPIKQDLPNPNTQQIVPSYISQTDTNKEDTKETNYLPFVLLGGIALIFLLKGKK